jgi:hypothetical protein
MKSRIIAAWLLASLVWWSVPTAMAGTSDTASVQPQAQRSSSGVHDHSCCPGLHLRIVPALLVTPAPADVPCERHPCCAKQAPGNPSALPEATQISRPGLDGLRKAAIDQAGTGSSGIAAKASSKDFFQSYSARSTVLRI